MASLQDPLLPGEDVWPVGLGIVHERECKEKIPRDDRFFNCMSIWQMLWFIIYCYILMCICVIIWVNYRDVTRPSTKRGFGNWGNPTLGGDIEVYNLEVDGGEIVQFTQIMNSQVSAIVACWISCVFFGPHLGVLPRCRGNHMEHLWVILQIRSAILAATLGFQRVKSLMNGIFSSIFNGFQWHLTWLHNPLHALPGERHQWMSPGLLILAVRSVIESLNRR